MKVGLGSAGVRAVKWSAISTVSRFGLQLTAQVVLTRLLGPENYGLFGIGMMVLTLSSFLSNFGFAWNLLHKKDVEPEDIRFTFTWQVVIGLVTTLAVWLLAPFIASYFRQDKVVPVIQWLSLTCLISAASATASNLLQRELKFRITGIVQVASYAIGYIAVGIPMAYMGFGVYSLVTAWLVQATVALVGSYGACPHAIRPLFHYKGSANAFGLGGMVFSTNIVNWFLNNIDRVLIGRLLSTHVLGLYSAAYNLATMPNTLLLGALQTSFMAVASKMSDDRSRLQKAYLEILSTIWTLLFPLFVVMAVLSYDLVQIIYGAQWSDTGWALGLLFLGMPAYVSWGVSTPVLWNSNRKSYECLLQIPIIVVGGLMMYLLIPRGILFAAAATSLLLVMRMVVITGAALKALDLNLLALAKPFSRGAALAIMGGGAASLGPVLFGRHGLPVPSLLIGGFAGMTVLGAIVLLAPRTIGAGPQVMLMRFFPKLRTVWKLEPVALSE